MMDKQMMVSCRWDRRTVDFQDKLADASQPLKKTVDQLLILKMTMVLRP